MTMITPRGFASLNSVQWLSVLASLCLLVVYTRSRRRHRSKFPLPPGPKGYPLIGNLLDFPSPTSAGWLTYDRWFKQYGDMVYFTVVGQPFLVIGSSQRANDLLEKRATNYSDRVQSTMMCELMGWNYSFGMNNYGSWWRRNRRQFHQHFNQAANSQNFHEVQIDEARALGARLLESPHKLKSHIRRAFAGTIMRISYGIPVESDDSEYIKRAEIALGGASEAGIPGAFLVDFIPGMRYIPSWFPGAGWKRKAGYWYSINHLVRYAPFSVVKKQLAEGTAPPSVTSDLIQSLPPKDDPKYAEEEQIAINVPATAFSGGADTTVATVQALFLALALNPKFAKKAQEEIDRVVGPDRLPEFKDQSSLHCVQAICREMLRWHSVTPLGVPHMSTEDDEYDGYFIPKGTIVMACSWSMMHDPKVFEDPLEFKPERYLTEDGKFNPTVMDPRTNGAFGFGRRGCPGRNVAENALYSITATMLAAFDISPPVDEATGKPRELDYRVTGGMLSYPEEYEVRITPRSAWSAELLTRTG